MMLGARRLHLHLIGIRLGLWGCIVEYKLREFPPGQQQDMSRTDVVKDATALCMNDFSC